MKEYMGTLDAMAAHHCDNAFFDINFSHNSFGIMLTTPSDMMHLFELGIVKCVYQTFVDSISTDVRVRVDNLMETFFRTVTVKASFAPTSAVGQCVSRCSAPTTNQA
jgi:hypothetical protein